MEREREHIYKLYIIIYIYIINMFSSLSLSLFIHSIRETVRQDAKTNRGTRNGTCPASQTKEIFRVLESEIMLWMLEYVFVVWQ